MSYPVLCYGVMHPTGPLWASQGYQEGTDHGRKVAAKNSRSGGQDRGWSFKGIRTCCEWRIAIRKNLRA